MPKCAICGNDMAAMNHSACLRQCGRVGGLTI